jgi:hypothetical protein
MSTKKQDLKKLISWAENLGYDVIFSKDGGNNICLETNTIEISSSNSLEERIFILSHECGHIIDANIILRKPNIKKDDTEREKKIRLWEEMNAWVEARKLMLKLDIVFDEKKLSKYTSICLEKYISAFIKQQEL